MRSGDTSERRCGKSRSIADGEPVAAHSDEKARPGEKDQAQRKRRSGGKPELLKQENIMTHYIQIIAIAAAFGGLLWIFAGLIAGMFE